MKRAVYRARQELVVFVPDWPDEFQYRSIKNPESGYTEEVVVVADGRIHDTTEAWECKMRLVAAERSDVVVNVEPYPLRNAARQGMIAGMAEEAKQVASLQQVGGDHYSKLAIQPMEYSIRNNLDPLQHTIVKYATRHKDKGGAEDIRKLIHTAQLILELQYGEGKKDEVQE